MVYNHIDQYRLIIFDEEKRTRMRCTALWQSVHGGSGWRSSSAFVISGNAFTVIEFTSYDAYDCGYHNLDKIHWISHTPSCRKGEEKNQKALEGSGGGGGCCVYVTGRDSSLSMSAGCMINISL